MMSMALWEITLHPPLLVEHTEEILLEKFGLDADKIAALRQKGAI